MDLTISDIEELKVAMEYTGLSVVEVVMMIRNSRHKNLYSNKRGNTDLMTITKTMREYKKILRKYFPKGIWR